MRVENAQHCNARDHVAIATLLMKTVDECCFVEKIIEFNGCGVCHTCDFIETSFLDNPFIDGGVDGTHEYIVGFSQSYDGHGAQVELTLITKE